MAKGRWKEGVAWGRGWVEGKGCEKRDGRLKVHK